jgi:hypothetical protein
MARANARTIRSLRIGSTVGSATMPALPPPWRSPAAAFFRVIARASRATSSTVTSGAMRTPPIAGPAAVSSMTTMPSIPVDGSRTSTTMLGPDSSHRVRHWVSTLGRGADCMLPIPFTVVASSCPAPPFQRGRSRLPRAVRPCFPVTIARTRPVDPAPRTGAFAAAGAGLSALPGPRWFCQPRR